MSIAETLDRCEQCVVSSITTVKALKQSFPDSLPLEKLLQELEEWQHAATRLKKANEAVSSKKFRASSLINQFKAMSFSAIRNV